MFCNKPLLNLLLKLTMHMIVCLTDRVELVSLDGVCNTPDGGNNIVEGILMDVSQ